MRRISQGRMDPGPSAEEKKDAKDESPNGRSTGNLPGLGKWTITEGTGENAGKYQVTVSGPLGLLGTRFVDKEWLDKYNRERAEAGGNPTPAPARSEESGQTDSPRAPPTLRVERDRVFLGDQSLDDSLADMVRDRERARLERYKLKPEERDAQRGRELDRRITELDTGIKQYSDLRSEVLASAGIEDTAGEEQRHLGDSRLERAEVDRALGGADAAKSHLSGAGREQAGRPGGEPGLRPGAPAGAPGFHAAGGRPGGDSFAPVDPSNPADERELALASLAGFQEVFERRGLRTGTGPGGGTTILRRDGTAASVGELAALAAAIKAEPQALMKRPDFFAVVSREEYAGLKRGYRGEPALRREEFKHIGLTEADRDFAWSESCARLSGDCNPNAKAMAYKKDELVEPEDLASIWDKIMRKADQLEAEAKTSSGSGAWARLSRRALRRDGQGLFNSLMALSGSQGSDARGSVAPPEGSGPAGALAPSSWKAPGRSAAIGGEYAGGPLPSAASPGTIPGRSARSEGPVLAGAGPARPSLLLWLLCLAGGGLLVLLGLRRTRSGAPLSR